MLFLTYLYSVQPADIDIKTADYLLKSLYILYFFYSVNIVSVQSSLLIDSVSSVRFSLNTLNIQFLCK